MARSLAQNRSVIANMPYAVKFDGTQRIALGTMGNLGSSLSGAFSFAIWVKTNSKLTTPSYFLGESNSSGGMFILFGITRTSAKVGIPQFQLRDAGGDTLAVEINAKRIDDSKWHLIIYDKDANNNVAGINVNIDGVEQTVNQVTAAAYSDPIDFNRSMAIGASLGSGAIASPLIGAASRPYFWKRKLTAQEKSDFFKKRIVPTGEFAGYPMVSEGGAGTTVTDSKATNNGTLTAAGQWTTQTPYKSRKMRTF